MANMTHRNRGGLIPWFDGFFDAGNFPGRSWLNSEKEALPAVNISEDDKAYTVEVAAPGFKKDDFKVNVENDILTITAETKNENKDDKRNYTRFEYSYSSFTRSFRLPDNAKDDGIAATYTDGMLKLEIPKSAQPVTKKKQISIK